MGVDFAVKVNGFPEHDDWNVVAVAIQKALDDVDNAMSTYKPDSEVCRFNASESTDWFPVSAKTAEVVQIAQSISAATAGAFDITVAPLVDLWGFGPKDESFTFEAASQKVAELKNRVGFDKLEVRLDPPALKKSIPTLSIDLSAIAKGFAVDGAAKVLDDHRIGNYIVEVAGEVRCKGKKGERAWIVGIEKPLQGIPGEFHGVQKKIQLGDQGLATSGNSQIFREFDGRRLSHIIDPRTGFPTEQIPEGMPLPPERLGSVSVIDTTCARADAWATAMFVLGEQEGLLVAEREKLAVLFLLRTDKKGTQAPVIREAPSKAFSAMY